MDKVILGKRIQEQRVLMSLTQDELAEMVGVGKIHISEIERGKKAPGMETFIRIVNSMDVSADLLLRDKVSGAKPYILNEITEKMRGLTPAQLKLVSDLFNSVLDNIDGIVKEAVKD